MEQSTILALLHVQARLIRYAQSWPVFVAWLGSYRRRACGERTARRRGGTTGVVHACAAAWRGTVGGWGGRGSFWGVCTRTHSRGRCLLHGWGPTEEVHVVRGLRHGEGGSRERCMRARQRGGVRWGGWGGRGGFWGVCTRTHCRGRCLLHGWGPSRGVHVVRGLRDGEGGPRERCMRARRRGILTSLNVKKRALRSWHLVCGRRWGTLSTIIIVTGLHQVCLPGSGS
jgi:hypothetical protein